MITPVYTAESTWGTVTVIKKIVSYAKSDKFVFSVYAANATTPNKLDSLPTLEYIDGVLVRRYSSLLSISSYQITLLMLLDLLRGDLDIIHAHCARSFQLDLAAFVSLLRRKPLIISAHGTLAEHLYVDVISTRLKSLLRVHNILLAFSLHQAKVVMALSKLEAEQYSKLFKVDPNRIVVLPNGIDLSTYRNLPPPENFKKKFGIASTTKIILYLGRINKIKGIEFLIKSFAQFTKNSSENIRLVVAGPDDGYLVEARQLSKALGIVDKVLFTGFLEEKDKLNAYMDATVVVHPESYNVILIAPLEAAAACKPIIVSSGNYLSEIARREGFGFSVDYGDIDSLANLLHKLVEDSDLAETMGRRGRKFVLGNLSWSGIVDVYARIYQRLS
jgi:glycosyltransferase involved in cell wall biosynthesis